MGTTKAFIISIILLVAIGAAGWFWVNNVIGSIKLIKDPAVKDTIGGILMVIVMVLWWHQVPNIYEGLK